MRLPFPPQIQFHGAEREARSDDAEKKQDWANRGVQHVHHSAVRGHTTLSRLPSTARHPPDIDICTLPSVALPFGHLPPFLFTRSDVTNAVFPWPAKILERDTIDGEGTPV